MRAGASILEAPIGFPQIRLSWPRNKLGNCRGRYFLGFKIGSDDIDRGRLHHAINPLKLGFPPGCSGGGQERVELVQARNIDPNSPHKVVASGKQAAVAGDVSRSAG
jgi:hypothetical protein